MNKVFSQARYTMNFIPDRDILTRLYQGSCAVSARTGRPRLSNHKREPLFLFEPAGWHRGLRGRARARDDKPP